MTILRNAKVALPVLTVMLCSACANFSPLTKRTEVASIPAGGAQWLTYDSSRRGTLMVRRANGDVVSCAEPAPDTAYGFDNSLTVEGEGGAAVDLGLIATVSALAGRDNLVLMTRESFFRLCEARANGFITDAEYEEQFTSILTKMVEIAAAVSKKSSDTVQALQAITRSR